MTRYQAVTVHAFDPADIEIPDGALVVSIRSVMHPLDQGHGEAPALEIICLVPKEEQPDQAAAST